VLEQDGRQVTVTATRGVVLSAGGFDHDLAMRRKFQSESLEDWSLGSEGNTGDAIKLAQDAGADTALMDPGLVVPVGRADHARR
jgi:3-oxosteroid 1-dehydrogenase